MFERFRRLIENGYRRNNFQLGWRFIYTNQATLNPDTSVLFVGLNPSLREGNEQLIAPFVENGNAFLTEQWDARGQRLQSRVRYFFEPIAHGIGQKLEPFLNTTLTLNYCPYRSKKWSELEDPIQAEAISDELWTMMRDYLHPRLIICNGNGKDNISAFFKMLNFFVGSGNDYNTIPTGRPRTNFRVSQNNGILIVGLPHLSYPTINHPDVAGPLEIIQRRIIYHLQNH